MAKTQKPIDECTAEELRTFGKIHYGIEMADRTNAPTAIAKLRAAGHGEDFILVDGPAPESVQDEAGNAAPAINGVRFVTEGGRQRKQIKIMIPVQDKPGGHEPVPTAVNGKRFDVPRGKEVWVYEEYVEALRNAQEWHFDNRPDDRGLTKPRVVQSYPFQVLAG